MPRNIKVTIEYDGTEYSGWQAQVNALGIQTVIEKVLARTVGERVRLVGSGRTDAGVHAAGQVANFWTHSPIPLSGLFASANHRLPRDIRFLDIEEVPDSFHARRDALWRTYRYTILNRPAGSALEGRYVWHVRDPLPAEVWDQLGRVLVGTHDFSSFQKAGSDRTNPVCTVADCRCWRDGDHVRFSITARSYLRGMVRAIIGTFYALARDDSVDVDAAKQELREILAAKDRGRAGKTAPASGLCLWRVRYP